MPNYTKVGLIAGAGALPHAVLAGAHSDGIEMFVATLEGYSSADEFSVYDYSLESAHFRLGDIGRLIKTLKQQKVDAICFAGIVKRPDFSALRPDLGAVKYLPGAIKAAAKGDDALLRYVTSIFEINTITVIGPQELCKSLLAPSGLLTRGSVSKADKQDAMKSREIAKAIGALDIGQGAVVASGLVLAVEAQEGTDAMLARVKALPTELKTGADRMGVLAKMVKPGQEDRVDLPTIGLETVRGAIEAGLSGICVEAGRAFVLDKDAAVALANEAGLFILGIEPEL